MTDSNSEVKASRPRRRWRTSHAKPRLYWIIGTIVLWSFLPVRLVDILIAPDWHAPHPSCDSLGIPKMDTLRALLPWALFSSLATALFVFPLTKGRVGGTDVFKAKFAHSTKAWLLTVAAGVLVAASLWDVGLHFYVALVAQTITSDCDGRAEPITEIMAGPLVQFSPVVELVFAFWVLHVRALALSPEADHGARNTGAEATR